MQLGEYSKYITNKGFLKEPRNHGKSMSDDLTVVTANHGRRRDHPHDHRN
jgi:hypothetical protein